LKEQIGHEVKQAVSTAMNDIVEKIVENLKTYNNLSISTFQKDIEVAMTAHPSANALTSNTIMKFDDVKYSVGITNLSTGKFTCKHEGLYLISASVKSSTNNAVYFIRLNGNDISLTHIGLHKEQHAHTGAVTVTRMLKRNDQVWLYAAGSWYLYPDP
ncbi:hypothetical protein AM593_04754, partial [Mytilus galloprovincialis]